MKKQEKIESWLDEPNGSNGVDLKIDDLKKQYTMLEEKAEDLRKQIKNTDDPDVKAKCKQMLSDIQEKQRTIKEKAESLKDGKEGENYQVNKDIHPLYIFSSLTRGEAGTSRPGLLFFLKLKTV